MTVQSPPAAAEMISIVLPVYNEADNIAPCLRQLWSALKDVPHEILVCYDFDADTTLPAIRQMSDCPATVRLVRNDLGRGVAAALRAGFAAARGDVIVTSMADLSNPPEAIALMADKIRDGAHVVSGSRYMRGGSQTGGPRIKTALSRLAGLSLAWIAGFRTHDATTNFRAYSAEFLRQTPVQSRLGFEVALELTVKAHAGGWRIDEVPSSWRDRTAGRSNFRLWSWLPRYLYWFMRAMAVPVLIWVAWLAGTVLNFRAAAEGFGLSAPLARGLCAGLSVCAFALIVVARRRRGLMSLPDIFLPIGMLALLLPVQIFIRLACCVVVWALPFALAKRLGRHSPAAALEKGHF